MKRFSILGLMLAALLMAVPTLSAQTSEKEHCTSIVSAEQIQAELERPEIEPGLPLAPPVNRPFWIPLTLHIVRRSDGTSGFTLAQVNVAMQDLNRLWRPIGMQFFQYGAIDYINSDYYFNLPNTRMRRDELRRVNPVADTINVYFTNLGGPCGESSFTTDNPQGILIDINCSGLAGNPSTLAHEIGHYFDLYHPHETAFGVECPNGSNCNTAGDRLCDTPADPDLSGRVTGACEYTGGVNPPAMCDSTPYAPLPNNIMSYSVVTCRTVFTTGQINKVLSVLPANRANLHKRVRYVATNAHPLIQAGTPDFPFRWISQALSAADPGNHIVIDAGSYPDALNINQNVTLRKWNLGAATADLGR